MMWMKRPQTSKRQARRIELSSDMLEGRQLMTVGMMPAFADVQAGADLSATDLLVISSLTPSPADSFGGGFTGAPDEILPYPYSGSGGSGGSLPK